jgi:DNA-binding IclR family transcriptional regulator
MAYALSGRGPYRKDLVDAGEPLAARLAGSIHETVVFATVARDRWIVLCDVDGDQHVQVRRSTIVENRDPYGTATGRAMLAFMPEQQREALVARRGPPRRDAWPGAETKAGLRTCLAAIRKKGHAVIVRDAVVALAYPVLQDDVVVAAVGCHLPKYRFKGDHRTRVMRGLAETAVRMGEVISAGTRRR